MMRSLFAILVMTVFTSLSAQGQPELEKRSLRGLKGITVLIENIDKDVEKNGLTLSQLRTDTELKLRKAGIPVVPLVDALKNPNVGTLHISVTGQPISDPDGLYLFNAIMEVLQNVKLVRDPSITLYSVTTYEKSTCATVGAGHIRDDVRNAIADYVDVFINDYLAMNPKP